MDWNDARWSTVWPKRERLTDQITPFLLDGLALRPGERVIDVGSGGGKTTLAAAAAVAPGGLAVGADVSGPLTQLASQRAHDAGARNVEFQVVDVQCDAIRGAPFDAAFSQFGVMFFDEPIAAFANLREHLKPKGRLRFACWQGNDKNPWFFGPVVAGFLPPPQPLAPGKSPTGPFTLADVAWTTNVLESAGFTGVRRTKFEIAAEAPQDALVDDVHLGLMGIPAANLARARAAIEAHMVQFKQPSGLSRFPLAFQIFDATNV